MATVAPSWAYTLHLPHDPRAPGIGRCTLRRVLGSYGLEPHVPTAELLAAELLANAQTHTDGEYALRIRYDAGRGRLRVGVWDRSPALPPGFGTERAAPKPGPGAESGRGLHLVRACADDYGGYALRELGSAHGGKLLWAECRV
ncbi:ATP-binding protein [Streptomyces sp. NRRL F-6674]|uniref:ATP-binding protein n=1 Tax=Streptomyces sp. NRRL F-6674 TaxID=1463877 RepID=UPI0004C09E08|nr:ATP-binding protein [Streptomyces sp. NRRL F-6674]